MKLSHIVLTNDFENYKISLINSLGANNLRFFECDDFKVEDAKNVIAEAYIAEISEKYIIIKAQKFGIEAQNTLLKILEEPPRNIIFIIITNSLNALLPTIRSRLLVKNFLSSKIQEPTGINFKKLTLKEALEFIDEKISLEKVGEFDKFKLRDCICQITKEALAYGINFSENELEYIDKLVYLANTNCKTHAVLTPLLLMMQEKI